MPSTQGGFKAHGTATAAGHQTGTCGSAHGREVCPKQIPGERMGELLPLWKRPVWKNEWFLSACLQPDTQALIHAGFWEMQNNGEGNKQNSG